MRSVWHSLLWKEWHEHKWKLAGLVALVLLLFALFSNRSLAMLPMGVSTTLFGYSIIATLLVGMHTAAGENGKGTMPFLQTLPIAMRKPAATKLAMSWLTLVLPIAVLLGAVFLYLQWQGRAPMSLWDGSHIRHSSPFRYFGFENWMTGVALASTLAVTSFLVWMAATGVNRSDEVRAAAIAFLAMAVVWFCLGGLLYQAEKANASNLVQIVSCLMATAPGGPALGPPTRSWSITPFVVVAILGHAGLIAWYLRRLGRVAPRPARATGGLTAPIGTDFLAPPRRSQLTAIIWKQVRETGPLAVLAAAAVLAMSGIYFWYDKERPLRTSFGEVLGATTLGVMYLVTVVAGMGVFLEDVKPQIGNFWRSRPINITQWFFVKLFTGLTVLVLTFGGLFLVAISFQGDRPFLNPKEPGIQFTFFVLIMVLLYTLSMASYCLGRQPIIAVVTAISVFVCGVYGFSFLFDNVLPHNVHWSVPMGGIVLCQLAAMTLAWLALRHNWGWHK